MVVFGAKMLVYASVLKTVEAELVSCTVSNASVAGVVGTFIGE